MKSLNQFIGILVVGSYLLLGCRGDAGQAHTEQAALQDVQEVTIVIDEEHQIFLDGEPITLDELEARLDAMAATATLDVAVHPVPETPMGLISEVRQRLPVGSDITLASE